MRYASITDKDFMMLFPNSYFAYLNLSFERVDRYVIIEDEVIVGYRIIDGSGSSIRCYIKPRFRGKGLYRESCKLGKRIGLFNTVCSPPPHLTGMLDRLGIGYN